MPRPDRRLGYASRRAAAGLILATLLLAPGCALQEYRFETHRERAEGFVESGQLDVALIELHSALAIHPDDPDVNFSIAELETRRSNAAEAKFYYGEANRNDPDNVEVAIKYGRLILAEMPFEGGQLIERAAALEPDNPWGQLGLSELSLVMGDTRRALRAAREAIRVAPELTAARWQLARVHFAQIRGLTLDGLGIPERLLTNMKLALAAYVVHSDNRARGVLESARVLSQVRGEQAQAEILFRDALKATAKRKGDEQLRIFAVREALNFAQNTERPTLELNASRHWVAAEPANLAAWIQLTEASEKSGVSKWKIFQRLLNERPDDPAAYLLIARTMAPVRGVDWATTFLRDAVEREINPPELLGLLADLQMRDGRKIEWEATVRNLVLQFPEHPRGKLARAHLMLARPAEGTSARDAASGAAPLLQRLVEHSESPLALRLLASAESVLENHARALIAIERAIELGGPSLEADRVHARVLYESGHWQYALTSLLRIASKIDLSNAEQIMLAGAAYRSDKAEFGRQTLMMLLQQEDAPTEAALELADHEIPDATLQPKIISLLDAELEAGSRNPRILALATALDLENGQRVRATRRLLRQIDGEIARGVRLLQEPRKRGPTNDDRAADERRAKVDRVRDRLAGLARYASTLTLTGEETRQIMSGLRAARNTGLISPIGDMWFGRLHLSAGNPRPARACFERAIAGGVTESWPKNELALLLARQRSELDRALVLAREVVAADPERAEALDTLGYVYLQAGQAEQALQQFRDAIDLSADANDPQATFEYHRGLALSALGQPEEASEAFEEALALDPTLQVAIQARLELRAAPDLQSGRSS